MGIRGLDIVVALRSFPIFEYHKNNAQTSLPWDSSQRQLYHPLCISHPLLCLPTDFFEAGVCSDLPSASEPLCHISDGMQPNQ